MYGFSPHDQQMQQELLGAALFEVALARHSFRVAQPQRDAGIDLIVYRDSPGFFWYALPLQLKFAVNAAFNRNERPIFDANPRDVIMVYIWVGGDAARFFLLSNDESRRVESDAEKSGLLLNVELLRAFEDRWGWLRDRLTGGSADSTDYRPSDKE